MMFWKYRDIDIDLFKMISKYINLIQAQEQDVNAQQGSLFYIDIKVCQWA